MQDIESARLRLGVTQTEVARRANLSPSTYFKARIGANRPSADTLRRFFEALQSLEAEIEAQHARLARIGNGAQRAAA